MARATAATCTCADALLSSHVAGLTSIGGYLLHSLCLLTSCQHLPVDCSCACAGIHVWVMPQCTVQLMQIQVRANFSPFSVLYPSSSLHTSFVKQSKLHGLLHTFYTGSRGVLWLHLRSSCPSCAPHGVAWLHRTPSRLVVALWPLARGSSP